MKKILTGIIVSFCFFIHNGVVSGVYADGLQKQGVIVVGGNHDYPPYEFIDEKGLPSGYSSELTNALGDVMGLRSEVVLDSWKNTREKLESGRIDAIHGMYYSKERDRLVDFSPPHTIIYNTVFSRSDASDIESMDQLRGKAIVVVEKGAVHDYLRSQNITDQFVMADSDGGALRMIASGKYDYAVLGKLPGMYLIKKLQLTNIKPNGPSILPFKYCFAVKEGNQFLLSQINEGMAILKKTGRYQEIYDKWLGVMEPETELRGQVVRYIAIVLITLFFIFGVGIIWVKSLTRKVAEQTADLNREILERKKAEAALKERSDFLDKVIGSSAVSTWISDAEGTLLRANPACLAFFGAAEEEIVGKYNLFRDSVLEEKGFMPVIKTVFEKAEPDSIIIDYDFAAVDHVNVKNATHKIVNSIFTPITDSEGRVTNVIVQAVDLTSIKEAEHALKESEEKHRALIENLSEMIQILDTEGGYIWCSPAIKQYGMTPEDTLGKQFIDYIHADGQSRVSEVIRQVVQTPGRVCTIEGLKFIADDGRAVFFDATFVFLPDITGVNGIVVTCRNVTERTLVKQKQSKLEGQLQQAQKMESIGTLAGGIAHDFNNMLGVITGNLSYALAILDRDNELYEVLSDVQASTKQAQNLTYQLLTFSRGGEPVKKPVEINKLIKESAIFSIRGAKTDCHFELADELWAAEVDEGQLNQVIGNLVINANQAMPDGGMVTIRTENSEVTPESGIPLPNGRYIKISVKDQGVGISKKHLSNIFEPYFTTKQQGSGLGLATTYSIIKKHDGHITVYSELEKGTEFFIYLPATLTGFSEKKEEKPVLHTGQGKVLVMDDQEPILRVAKRMLTSMGYETDFAEDGSEAIEKYRQALKADNRYDLVILDLTIPGKMGGAKTIRELIQIDPDVKALVSSGYSNDPVMANYEEYGFCGVIQKPYTKEQIGSVLSRLRL